MNPASTIASTDPITMSERMAGRSRAREPLSTTADWRRTACTAKSSCDQPHDGDQERRIAIDRGHEGSARDLSPVRVRHDPHTT